MQILKAPDFFLLTHGFGLSTRAMTPSSLSRVRFRLEFFFQFFGYSPSWSNFGSHVFIHFYMCTTPGKQPSWRLNTAEYCVTTWSAVNRWFTTGLFFLSGGADLKLSQFTVMSFICCAALAPIRGS